MDKVLIFGASGFVGTSVANRLARDHRVVGTYLRAEGTAAIDWRRVDLRDPAAIVEMLDGLDEVPSAVIQCAGVGKWAELREVDVHAWDEAMAVNTRSLFVAAKWFAERWTAGGRIVAITAMPGLTNVPAPPHIAAANAALSGLVKALAGELGERGIAVNAVMLGPLEGGLGGQIPQRLQRDYARFSSLKRCCTVEEAAEVVAFCLAGPRAMTGTVISANGGL